MASNIEKSATYFLDTENFEQLIFQLMEMGYTVIGPVEKGGAISMDIIDHFSDLARGFSDVQSPGRYQLERDGKGESFFDFVIGHMSLKNHLNPSRHRLWKSEKNDEGRLIFQMEKAPETKYAFVGVRSCDLMALKVQSKVFEGDYPNTWFQKLKSNALFISTSCNHPSDNCFCTTMGHGPKPSDGFDLNLNEISPGNFLVTAGSEDGMKILSGLKLEKAKEDAVSKEELLYNQALSKLEKRFDMEEVRGLLKEKINHPHWEEIAKKCLSCANCTMVCPTCFCTTTEDLNDLKGKITERWLSWDSCFNQDFSYIHGSHVRDSTKSRYRQWMTHKLSNWHDQFDTSGCVGCGRCITWCPVGIDITKELQALKD